jgi:hypothetical protein
MPRMPIPEVTFSRSFVSKDRPPVLAGVTRSGKQYRLLPQLIPDDRPEDVFAGTTSSIYPLGSPLAGRHRQPGRSHEFGPLRLACV